jgi:hypothetical protein
MLGVSMPVLDSARSVFRRGSSDCRFHDGQTASGALPPSDPLPSALGPVGADSSLVHSRVNPALAAGGPGGCPRLCIAPGTSVSPGPRLDVCSRPTSGRPGTSVEDRPGLLIRYAVEFGRASVQRRAGARAPRS